MNVKSWFNQTSTSDFANPIHAGIYEQLTQNIDRIIQNID